MLFEGGGRAPEKGGYCKLFLLVRKWSKLLIRMSDAGK